MGGSEGVGGVCVSLEWDLIPGEGSHVNSRGSMQLIGTNLITLLLRPLKASHFVSSLKPGFVCAHLKLDRNAWPKDH